MKVYHGSTVIVRAPLVGIGRNHLDFGKGFYVNDIIEGGIANDRVFNTIELYAQGLISQDEALQRLKSEKPNNQICIINQLIVDGFMSFVESVTLN